MAFTSECVPSLAIAAATIAADVSTTPRALGKPGLTPVPCPTRQWQPAIPTFDALPGAKALFGKYDGGALPDRDP